MRDHEIHSPFGTGSLVVKTRCRRVPGVVGMSEKSAVTKDGVAVGTCDAGTVTRVFATPLGLPSMRNPWISMTRSEVMSVEDLARSSRAEDTTSEVGTKLWASLTVEPASRYGLAVTATSSCWSSTSAVRSDVYDTKRRSWRPSGYQIPPER